MSDCTRHLGGCLLARAPDLLFDESEGLYETCLFCFLALGSFGAPSLVSSDVLGILWELMGSQLFSAGKRRILDKDSIDSIGIRSDLRVKIGVCCE